jgi:hypothetical protein
MGCDISLLATDWFLCLFCTSLPIESAARVWDALLCEGPKVLLRVGLAVGLLLGPTMMKRDNPGGEGGASCWAVLSAAAAGNHPQDAWLLTVLSQTLILLGKLQNQLIQT